MFPATPTWTWPPRALTIPGPEDVPQRGGGSGGTGREGLYKLAVFVPLDYEDPVRLALAEAGLGSIGRYSHCSFAARGQGSYQPLQGAHPFVGEAGKLSRVEEVRLELLAPESLLPAALAKLRQAHPYEEVAYDLYPLQNPGRPRGFGRLGRWPASRPFPEVVSLVKRSFRWPP